MVQDRLYKHQEDKQIQRRFDIPVLSHSFHFKLMPAILIVEANLLVQFNNLVSHS